MSQPSPLAPASAVEEAVRRLLARHRGRLARVSAGQVLRELEGRRPRGPGSRPPGGRWSRARLAAVAAALAGLREVRAGGAEWVQVAAGSGWVFVYARRRAPAVPKVRYFKRLRGVEGGEPDGGRGGVGGGRVGGRD